MYNLHGHGHSRQHRESCAQNLVFFNYSVDRLLKPIQIDIAYHPHYAPRRKHAALQRPETLLLW
jgi:hypothetical protein